MSAQQQCQQEKEVQLFPVTDEERKLLEYFREVVQYGEVTVVVKRGRPVFIRQVIKEVKLDS